MDKKKKKGSKKGNDADELDLSLFKDKKSKKSGGKKKPKVEMVTDKLGNRVEKGSATDPEVIAAREEAKRRREAKASAAVGGALGGSPPEPPAEMELVEEACLDSIIVSLEGKLASGLKLSGKEKKLLAKSKAEDAEKRAELDLNASGLKAFTLSMAGGVDSTSPPEEGGGPAKNLDISFPKFSILGPAHPLLEDAGLVLAQGRRYGLLGNNGSGKSTLLKFLGQKPCQLPLPRGLSVLLVKQEVMFIFSVMVNCP
jgi:ATP-binding cassette subfamily F protein 1